MQLTIQLTIMVDCYWENGEDDLMADRLEQIRESPEAQVLAYRWPDAHSERECSLLGIAGELMHVN